MSDQDLVNAIHRLEINLSNKLTVHTQKLDEHCDKLDTIFKKIERLDKTVYGVGGDQDGLATRMKVMEQSESNRKTFTYTVFGVAVPPFLNWLYELMK